jgi:hypothetical protein
MEDDKLYDLSTKFTDVSSEAKRILDALKQKSSDRQSSFGIENGADDRNQN